MKKRLVALTIAVGSLLPLGVHAAHAADIRRPWACVAEVDLNIGVCVDNPIPPPPFGLLGVAPL